MHDRASSTSCLHWKSATVFLCSAGRDFGQILPWRLHLTEIDYSFQIFFRTVHSRCLSQRRSFISYFCIAWFSGLISWRRPAGQPPSYFTSSEILDIALLLNPELEIFVFMVVYLHILTLSLVGVDILRNCLELSAWPKGAYYSTLSLLSQAFETPKYQGQSHLEQSVQKYFFWTEVWSVTRTLPKLSRRVGYLMREAHTQYCTEGDLHGHPYLSFSREIQIQAYFSLQNLNWNRSAGPLLTMMSSVSWFFRN